MSVSPVCVLVSPLSFACGLIEWREGACCAVPCLVLSPSFSIVSPVFVLDPAPRIVQSSLRRIPLCRAVRFFFVLLCCCVVCGERNGGGVRGVRSRRLFSSSIILLLPLPPPLPLRVGVRGSARAALRARTLSPNTIASLLLSRLLFSSLALLAFLRAPSFLLLEWRRGDSPCVAVLCWHDCDG